jgi:hypothetical protein
MADHQRLNGLDVAGDAQLSAIEARQEFGRIIRFLILSGWRAALGARRRP